MTSYLLALENSQNNASVALLQLDPKKMATPVCVLADSLQERTTEQLLPLIDQLLTQAQVDKKQLATVAFSNGPGAFTGIRMACAMAQGISLGLTIPVIPVDSLLATLYLNLPYLKGQETTVLVLLDARMDEVFMAVYRVPASFASNEQGIYEVDRLTVLQSPCLIAAKDVFRWLQAQSWYQPQQLHCLLGNALETLVQELLDLRQLPCLKLGLPEWPKADTIALLGAYRFAQGKTMDSALVAPVYIRDKVAFTQTEREQGMGGNPKAPLPASVAMASSVPMDLPKGFELLDLQMNDVDEVVAIEQTLDSLEPWTYNNFVTSLKSDYPAWVVKDQKTGKIVAYAVQMLAPDTAHLLIIGVRHDQQRQGLGKFLLQVLEQNAVQAGLTSQLLEVRVSNHPALSLYYQAGYRQIGLRKGYYKGVAGTSEDALVLQKEALA